MCYVPDCSRTAVGSPTSPAEEGSSSMAEQMISSVSRGSTHAEVNNDG
jgi:hypothetical protein